jgi:NarL family two-component system response regulator LiaR
MADTPKRVGYPDGKSAEHRETTMSSTTGEPELRFSTDRRESADTGTELMSRPRPASGRATLRVLIANHQPIVRYALKSVITSEPDLQVIGETDDGGEAVRFARQLRPDIALIDLSMPTVDGISATRMIRAALPNTQVVVVSGVDEDTSAVEAIRAGAAAYLLKDVRIEELLRAIRGASTGQIVLPASMATRMVRPRGGHDVLSHRESEIVHLVAHGLANKQVARQLGIMESTVKTHMSGILSKLGLASRTQLALYAARNGLAALDHLGADSGASAHHVLVGA